MTTEAESVAASSPSRATVEAGWRKWMVAFGRHLRRVRELLGLSQEELARLAGVSQGAVSRFESGRGLNTPFLLILRVNMALARRLRGIDPGVLSADARRFLSHMEFFKPPESGAPPRPRRRALRPARDTRRPGERAPRPHLSGGARCPADGAPGDRRGRGGRAPRVARRAAFLSFASRGEIRPVA